MSVQRFARGPTRTNKGGHDHRRCQIVSGSWHVMVISGWKLSSTSCPHSEKNLRFILVHRELSPPCASTYTFNEYRHYILFVMVRSTKFLGSRKSKEKHHLVRYFYTETLVERESKIFLERENRERK